MDAQIFPLIDVTAGVLNYCRQIGLARVLQVHVVRCSRAGVQRTAAPPIAWMELWTTGMS